MYFTPIAAHRRWIDNVKSLCTRNPGACGGSNTAAMSYASATPQSVQPQYSYQSVQPAQPTYQTVAYAEPAQPTYIDVGSAYGYAAAPAPAYYQPATPSYQPATPPYIDTGVQYGAVAPVYDNHGYAPVHAPVYGGYNVAYAQPAIIYGSAFRHHAR